MSHPSFVVFDEDYSAARLAGLLGVVVTNVCRPLDDFCPSLQNTERLQYMDEYVLDKKLESKATVKTNAIRSTKAEASLSSLFGLSGDWSRVDEYNITSSKMTTISIERMQDAYDELIVNHGEKVRDFFNKPSAKSGVYMLVGFKTAENPKVTKSWSRSKSASVAGSTKGITTASTGIPVDASASASVKISRQGYIEGTAEVERAFSGQYIKIVWKTTGLEFLSRGKIHVKRDMAFGGVQTYGEDKLAFTLDSDDSDTDCDTPLRQNNTSVLI